MRGAQKVLWLASLSALAAAAPLGGCGSQDERAGEAQNGADRAAPRSAEEGEAARRFRAFVAIEDEDRLAILDGPPWRLVRKVPVPTGPHNVAADPSGRYVAVSSPPAGRVAILASRGNITARVPAGPGAHDVAFTPSGELWVTAEDSRRIVKLRAPSGEPVVSRSTSGPPHDLAVSPDGGELWVTVDGDIAPEVRDAGGGRLLARPGLGPAPHDIEISPDGRQAWFSNWSSPLLTVASLERRMTVGRLTAGGEPHHFAFGAGSLWVSDNASGELLRIDPRSRQIRGRTRVGAEPHHAAVAGQQVLVAVHRRGQVAVVSRRGRLLRHLAAGLGPHGIAVLQR